MTLRYVSMDTQRETQTKFSANADAFRSIQAVIIKNIDTQTHRIIFSRKMIYKLFGIFPFILIHIKTE